MVESKVQKYLWREKISEERPIAEVGFLGESHVSVKEVVGGRITLFRLQGYLFISRIGVPMGTIEKGRREGNGGRLSSREA